MLALKLIQAQGIEAIPVRIATPFLKHEEVEWVKPIEVSLGEEYLELVKRPKHGYGKHLNPCIDCKIYFLKVAREIMEYVGAKGVATGEVIGQRPMSQRKSAMAIIEKKAKLRGKLLRPLCAKLLPPTEMEESGLIDREQLFDIKGRGRKRQLELAKQLGITDYKSPAGRESRHARRRRKDGHPTIPDPPERTLQNAAGSRKHHRRNKRRTPNSPRRRGEGNR